MEAASTLESEPASEWEQRLELESLRVSAVWPGQKSNNLYRPAPVDTVEGSLDVVGLGSGVVDALGAGKTG